MAVQGIRRSRVRTALQAEARAAANSARAASAVRFFKTGKGQYGEGDCFLGIPVPALRAMLRRHADTLSLADAEALLDSRWHEERFLAAVLFVRLYGAADTAGRQTIARSYLANAKRFNNWDLVDASAPYVLGRYLVERHGTRPEEALRVLRRLARSPSLWERRVAIVATHAFTRAKNPAPCFTVADLLLHDKEDLLHKATGWMLREVGKHCGERTLERYLRMRHQGMPRTALRSAVERFPQKKRKAYLTGRV